MLWLILECLKWYHLYVKKGGQMSQQLRTCMGNSVRHWLWGGCESLEGCCSRLAVCWDSKSDFVCVSSLERKKFNSCLYKFSGLRHFLKIFCKIFKLGSIHKWPHSSRGRGGLAKVDESWQGVRGVDQKLTTWFCHVNMLFSSFL